MAIDRANLTRQIREANDIVAVVGSYLSIRRAGKDYVAICPFHNDHHPSLRISPGFQNFRCWSCGEKGDVFDFVQKIEKIGFLEARHILAERAGISLDQLGAGPNPGKLRLLEAMKWAEEQYRECLLQEHHDVTIPNADQARQYLGERKLTGTTVRKFGLGYAPADRGWLTRRARETKQDFQVLLELGLLLERNDNQGFFDRFQDRIMFPIRDVRGQTVGFGGRILPDSPFAARGPKYYNSSDNPLFKKSDLLYGLDFARHEGASEGFLAVVEGYTDVMMAHQFGITNVIATMGTALTERHVAQLSRYVPRTSRYVPRIVLVYDADEGGKNGVDRALELFISQDVELAIATLPDGLDPCDLLVQQGADAFRNALRNAEDALDFKLNQLLERERERGIEGQRRVIDAILGIMALAPEMPGQNFRLKCELILTRIAQRLMVDLNTVQRRYLEIKQARKKEAERSVSEQPAKEDSAENEAPRSGPAPQLEVQLLQLVLADSKLVAQAMDEVPAADLTHPGLRKLLDGLYQLEREGEIADIDGLRSLVPNPALIAKAMELMDVGQMNTEREKWLRVVLNGFAERRKESHKGLMQQKLSNADHQAALELFSKLQTQTKAKDT